MTYLRIVTHPIFLFEHDLFGANASRLSRKPGFQFSGSCSGRAAEGKMSIEIDVLNGDASWPLVRPLFDAVWPPHVVATLPWAEIAFAHAELRVLVQDDAGETLCHVGIYRRDVTWNGRKVPAAGI